MGVSRKQSTSKFPKNKHFLPPDTYTCVCVSGVMKCLFLGNFGVLCFLETPVLRFALLPYYRRIDGFTKVALLRKKHIKNLFFGHLNINSLRSKSEFLEPLITYHFGIFLVSETKLDSSFRGSEFTITGYRLFRKYRNQHG